MNGEKNCAKCCEAIAGIEFVSCRGYCGCMFHMTCANVSRALLGYFSPHRKNLFWMCDKCAELFGNSHLRAITKVADEKSPLVSLTEAISNLHTEIKQLSQKPVPCIQSPSIKNWPQIGPIRAAKRLRGPDLAHKVTECQSGSKQLDSSVKSVPVCAKPVNKFWLYLSRIRPDVTNEEVLAMVRANLDTTQDPEVVKLVAKGTDTSSMTFVSFKVGLDPSLKTNALNPSTWPEGIMFREFEDNSAQNFRKPSAVYLTPTSRTPPSVSMKQ